MFCICFVIRAGRHAFGKSILQYLPAQEFLYSLEKVYILIRYEGDGHSVALCTRRTAYAMNIVLYVMRHIIVDDHEDIIDVDAASHDIGGNENGHFPRLETVHHLVALRLRKVGMHLAAVDFHLPQGAVYLLDPLLLA